MNNQPDFNETNTTLTQINQFLEKNINDINDKIKNKIIFDLLYGNNDVIIVKSDSESHQEGYKIDHTFFDE
jgi:hypothetical protein